MVAMKKACKGRFLWLRMIVSTLVGELLDTLIFCSIAALSGVHPLRDLERASPCRSQIARLESYLEYYRRDRIKKYKI